MKNLFTFFFFLITSSFTVSAQNWNPINLEDVYNFQQKDSNYISNSIWIDSIATNLNDTLFYLNRIVKECPSCSPGSKLANQEQFMNAIMIKRADNVFDFIGDTSFQIRSLEQLNQTWTFDSLNNIQATIISVDETEIFGQIDSSKTIMLSSGDSIILSKNYGILEFNFFNKKFKLEGIQNKGLGEVIPDIKEFMDFNVGDVFQYRISEFSFSGWRSGVIKRTIIDKVENDSQIIYTENVIKSDTLEMPIGGFEYHYSSEEHNFSVNTLATNFIENKYNNQIVFNEAWSDFCYSFEGDYFVRALKLRKNEDDQRISLGTGNLVYDLNQDTEQGFLMSTDSDTIVPIECEHDFYIVYTTGLGITFEHNEIIDNTNRRKLIGYVKGVDTVGTITPDEDLLVSTQELAVNKESNLKIMSNPGDGFYTIEFMNETPTSLEVYSLDGVLVKSIRVPLYTNSTFVDITILPSGVYILKSIFDNYEQVYKIIKI